MTNIKNVKRAILIVMSVWLGFSRMTAVLKPNKASVLERISYHQLHHLNNLKIQTDKSLSY